MLSSILFLNNFFISISIFEQRLLYFSDLKYESISFCWLYPFKYSVLFITKLNNFSSLLLLIIRLFNIILFRSFISYIDVCKRYLSERISFMKCWKTIFSLVQYRHSNTGKGVLFKSSFVLFFLDFFLSSLISLFSLVKISLCISDSSKFILSFWIFILLKFSKLSSKLFSVFKIFSFFLLSTLVSFISFVS